MTSRPKRLSRAKALRPSCRRPDLPGRRRLRGDDDACRRRAAAPPCRQARPRRPSAPSSTRRSPPANCPAPWSCWASATGSCCARPTATRSVMPAVKPATLDTIYDAASLTKVMATAVAIQQLVERGQIDLDRPAAAYWPAFAANGKGDITVRQLIDPLRRPAGRHPDARAGRTTEGALDAIVALKPLAPAGTRFVYSDVDFIVLGEIVRRVSGQPLETYAAKNIFQPLGMTRHRLPAVACAAGPHRAGRRRRRRAALGRGPGSDRLSHGRRRRPCRRVHHRRRPHQVRADDAGGRQGRAEAGLRRGDDARRRARPAGPPLRGLGWDIDLPYAVWFAPSFSTRSYGHTGYTGTAIWIDPDDKTFLIVAHQPAASRRQGQHPADAAAHRPRWPARRRSGRAGQVLSGIDVLEAYGFRELRGAPRRAHHQQLGARLRRDGATVDVLHQAPGPQAGGAVQPRARAADAVEPRARSPRAATPRPACRSTASTASTVRPTAAMLAGLDALVFDMQDVGTRYYTYPTTMAYAMEAAAQQKLDFRARPARPDHRRHGAGRGARCATSPRSSPTCRCRCATA